MIKYEFIATDPGAAPIFIKGEDGMAEYVEARLRVLVPVKLMVKIGVDRLQKRVMAAAETMIKELNSYIGEGRWMIE